MRRVLVGVVGVAVLAAAGFFGVRWYAQHRAEREVETAFDQIRSSGAKASHGAVAFDLWTRTLTVADISSESPSEPPVTVKIGRVTASSLSQPDVGRFSAASIDVDNVELGVQQTTPVALHLGYKMPKITVKDYAGPINIARPPASSSTLEVYAFVFKQFAAMSASSVTAPSMALAFDIGPTPSSRGEFIYTGISADGIKDGKIANHTIDSSSFTIEMQQAGKPEKMTGHIVNIAFRDFDMNAIAAAFDPQKANDDQIYRVYRQTSFGLYETASLQGFQSRTESMTLDDVGLRPSKIRLPALLALITQPPQTPPTPAQIQSLAAAMAGLYEGLHIGAAEVKGITVSTPGGPVKLASIKSDLQDGKANLAIEGLDGQTPQGPFKLGRFALTSLDFAGLIRTAAQYVDPRQQHPGMALDFLHVIGGIEMKDFVAPYKTTTKTIKVDNFNFNWGQFVGPIPTQAHLTAKAVGPVDASNPALLPLLAAGIDTLALDADIGAGWTEGSGALTLAPGKIEIGNVLSATIGVSFAKVPRTLFTPNPQQAMVAASTVEAGSLELTLHDLGGVDLAIAQFARTHTIDRDAARQAILDSIKKMGAQIAGDNADAAAAVDAIGRFIETPHQTLTLKLTPKAKVPVMQLVQLLNTDPSLVLPQFKIEAATGL